MATIAIAFDCTIIEINIAIGASDLCRNASKANATTKMCILGCGIVLNCSIIERTAVHCTHNADGTSFAIFNNRTRRRCGVFIIGTVIRMSNILFKSSISRQQTSAVNDYFLPSLASAYITVKYIIIGIGSRKVLPSIDFDLVVLCSQNKQLGVNTIRAKHHIAATMGTKDGGFRLVGKDHHSGI